MSDVDPQRRSNTHFVVNALVSIAVLGVCLYAYTLLGERKRPQRSKPAKPDAMMVVAQPLRRHQGPVNLMANGVVVPLREIRLATEVAGRVVELSPNMRPGRIVSADEILIQLESIQYDLEVERLRAQQSQEAAELALMDVSIRNAKEIVSLAEQQLEVATGERRRMDSLVQRNAASSSEVDAAKRAELEAKASLVGVQNNQRELVAQRELIVQKRALTQVGLQRAELDQSRTTVRSPIAGRVVASTVEEQSFVPTGTSFVTIEDTSAVEVRANLTADQMVWVWGSKRMLGDDTKLGFADDDRVPAIPATVEYRLGSQTFCYDAVLERIDGAGIDLNTRTYPCLFRVQEPLDADAIRNGQQLMRGMFVSVMVKAMPDRTLHQVSESAIRPGGRLWLNDNQQLRITPVTIVGREQDAVIVDLNGAVELASSDVSSAPDRAIGVIVSPISDPVAGMRLMDQATTTNPRAKVAEGSPVSEQTSNEKVAR